MERFCVCSETIKAGVIIIYKLRTDQRPRQPDKEWRGKVLYYDRLLRMAMVESLEEGYVGCKEDVRLEQIIKVVRQ